MGYKVNSVELDNLGWDLEVIRKQTILTILRVEVKGKSGSNISVDLTPNEYKKMMLYKNSYRLAVVTNVLN